MRQQINLYDAPPGHNAWQDWYPIPQVGIGFLVLLVVLYSVEFLERADLEQQLNDIEQQVATRQAEFDRLKISMPGADLDPELEREVEALQAELIGKRELLRTVNLRRVDVQSGFSNHLEGLARQTMQGLWLTSIQLSQGGARVGLQGQAAKPEFVPQLIKSLAAEDAYLGTEFDVFNLSREQDQEYLGFELRADRTE